MDYDGIEIEHVTPRILFILGPSPTNGRFLAEVEDSLTIRGIARRDTARLAAGASGGGERRRRSRRRRAHARNAAGARVSRGERGARAAAAAAAATRCCRVPVRRAPPDTSVVRAAHHTTSARIHQRSVRQMSSPTSTLADPVASIVRPLEGRISGEVSSGASSDATEDFELPQCKIKRNYNCPKCTFYTQNPRAYLLHTRDVHFEKIKIYDCSFCVYASKHCQKLVRHIKMVHNESPAAVSEPDTKLSNPAASETSEQIDDMVEEIEDCDEQVMDLVTNVAKDKSKYFCCDKCNYVTHIRARYTKHVKYHSTPMIKCTICDFRTPYKWNLDRHMKNHGGTGSFSCSMCNFTADIKQSLTVHEMNHHAPTVGQSCSNRRRNRVGASDTSVARAESAMHVKEDEGSGDSRSSCTASDMGLHDADIEMITCNSESNDASDDAIKNDDSQDYHNQQTLNNSSSDESRSNKQSRKISRPIPQLIPLNASTPNQNKVNTGEPPKKKLKENPESLDLTVENKSDVPQSDITFTPSNNLPKEPVVRKKNESFFDRLKERLLTETGDEGSLVCKNCKFESKCLSEYTVHEKNCTSQINRITPNPSYPLSSTRCQNCRHRCKSSADLFNHLRTCKKNNETESVIAKTSQNQNNHDASITQEKETEPHPMENVVFVWNNINRENSKFNTPLDININDDSTLPEVNKSFDSEITDADNDGMNLSPSHAMGKKVFKCPHCQFWASSASRFHVHIVGHLNKKPFECSLCKYRSNWRWDITKHIKLKSARDPEHNEAKVLMTDETGRRNYSKYNKFLAISILNESGENEFHYVDPNTSVDAMMEVDESIDDNQISVCDVQPLNLQTQNNDQKYDSTMENRTDDMRKPKKTFWKCKKCNYKDPSKEALLEHVRNHSKADGGQEDIKSNNKKLESTTDPADLAYRCGHCNQLSNWKHVIQRHCRLKHDGVIKVITTVKPKGEPGSQSLNEIISDTCSKCPFKADDKKTLLEHLQQHQPSPESIFKCYFCPFFVKNEHELMQHLVLHGINDPEDYIAKAMGCKSPLPDQTSSNAVVANSSSTKRHKCTECPYETNSKSQFMYHEQFHRLPADTPYKCQVCNYSVSKRHLLHQHMRVHGIFPKKFESDTDVDAPPSQPFKAEIKMESTVNIDEIPYVWVSAKNEFHKMYKCRYCSYVNSQKNKIPYHEKIHFINFENSEITIYKCLECKFTCDNALRLAEHSKTHGEIYGRIYCPVEEDIPDDEQISKLRKVIENEKICIAEDMPKEDWGLKDVEAVKTLYFCQKCPARFFTESDLKLHDKNHDLSLPNKCKSCEFSVPSESDLTEHVFVHSDEHQTKTKMLKFMHNSHPAHKEPRLELIHCQTTSEITWVVSHPSKNFQLADSIKKTEIRHVPKQYFCQECPAKFLKSSALSYHVSLHGADGDYKCKKCNYSVKNSGNLAKHELLHENDGKTSNCDYESGEDLDYKNVPLSGTDLFQRKTEAQKRVLNGKDKLVKPNDHFPPVLQADPQFGYLMHGNPEFIYPTYLKNGRQKEKRYKCHKCPSAFEKREQYKIHLSLHGSKQRYKCELCDYSVKYYANYVQHMRKHQMNDEAQAERKKCSNEFNEPASQDNKEDESPDNIKLAIKTMPKPPPRSDFQQFSISDQQTLRLLQRRRSANNAEKETNPSEQSTTKERKLHMCLFCPFTNQRQDALSNHRRRHNDEDVLNVGHHRCPYCDLSVVQSHFLRDHIKMHFSYQKTLIPECFLASEEFVSFKITKLDDENTSEDLILVEKDIYKCNEDKMFVNIKTGEVKVE